MPFTIGHRYKLKENYTITPMQMSLTNENFNDLRKGLILIEARGDNRLTFEKIGMVKWSFADLEDYACSLEEIKTIFKQEEFEI